MGSTFGTPVPVGSQAAASDPSKVNGAAVPDDKVQQVIDENDPRLISENLDVNLEADAYAQQVPPPDRKWQAKLKLEGFKVEGQSEPKDYGTGTDKDNAPHFKTNISCQVIDPSGRFDGITVYPGFGGGISTKRRKDGSTQVTTILARIKKPDGKSWADGFSGTQLQWMQRFVAAMKTEPQIGVETAWEVTCQECGKELEVQRKAGKDVGYPTRTTGMHHFPQETDAGKKKLEQTHQSELKCAKNPGHGYSRARAIVQRFLHLHEVNG